MMRILVLAAGFLLLPSMAEAASCRVTISDLAFGAIDSLYAAPADSASSIQIDCDDIAPATQTMAICLGLGAGSGGQVGGVRHMAAGSETLDFQLYADSNRGIGWGSIATPSLGSPQRFDLPVSGETASASYSLYGRVFGSQIAATAGSYSASFSGADASYSYAEETLDCDQPGGAQGGETTFTVTASVAANCLVDASDIEFGQHAEIGSPVDAEGTIDITCTPGTDYSVTLGGGLRNSQNPEQRILQSGQVQATYGLYRDDARSQPWGSSLETQLPGTGAGLAQSVVVYGRVPPQNLRPGTYTDTVNVTITYDGVP